MERAHQGRQRTVGPFPHGGTEPVELPPGVPDPARYAHGMITALAGGVGAARFLRGLVQVVDPADVTVVVNTADDDWFHGLYVCPDLDTVTYTLAGAQQPRHRAGAWRARRFATVDALARYGEDTWFRLGDRDLATHLFRTRRLREGATADRGHRRDHRRLGPRPPPAAR